MSNPDQNLAPDEIEGEEDPQVVELVAYLDGELPASDADRVEQLLLKNAAMRKNVESLDRTWQLLSTLEEATVSGEFTQKTLASISAVSAESSGVSRTGGQRWRPVVISRLVLIRGLIWFLAGFIGCSAGLVLSRKVRRDLTSPADAEILNHLDLYLEYPKLWRIPDEEFLREVSETSDTGTARGELP